MNKLMMIAFLSLSLSACGPLLGLKKIDAWGFKTEFNPGIDFNLGANAIDQVDNKRSINKASQTKTTQQ